MASDALRAWWWHRQGLDGTLAGAGAAAILATTGWARSVGGSNPYLTLFARAGSAVPRSTRRPPTWRSASSRRLAAAPTSCPRPTSALALQAGRHAPEAEARLAERLGVPRRELDDLCGAVLDALDGGPLDPAELKKVLGPAVREPRRGRAQEGPEHDTARRARPPAGRRGDPPDPGERPAGPAAIHLRALAPHRDRPDRRGGARRAGPQVLQLDRRRVDRRAPVVHRVLRPRRQGGRRRASAWPTSATAGWPCPSTPSPRRLPPGRPRRVRPARRHRRAAAAAPRRAGACWPQADADRPIPGHRRQGPRGRPRPDRPPRHRRPRPAGRAVAVRRGDRGHRLVGLRRAPRPRTRPCGRWSN